MLESWQDGQTTLLRQAQLPAPAPHVIFIGRHAPVSDRDAYDEKAGVLCASAWQH